MSQISAPPVPPPLPPTAVTYKMDSPKKNLGDVSPTFTKLNICEWAIGVPQFWEACAKNNICSYQPPYQYKYRHFESIIQVGPTCGLVALSMLVNGEVTASEMLNITKLEGHSHQGEMFSCRNMMRLTEKVFSLAEIENIKYHLRRGDLFSNEVIKKLLEGAVLLVPYDADFNNEPCLKKGHKAHWALVSGIIVIDEPKQSYTSDPNNVFVLCKHGKSRYLSAWKLNELYQSNKNLWEFSPEREDSGYYILPEGGVGGENGLRDQFLMFEGF